MKLYKKIVLSLLLSLMLLPTTFGGFLSVMAIGNVESDTGTWQDIIDKYKQALTTTETKSFSIKYSLESDGKKIPTFTVKVSVSSTSGYVVKDTEVTTSSATSLSFTLNYALEVYDANNNLIQKPRTDTLLVDLVSKTFTITSSGGGIVGSGSVLIVDKIITIFFETHVDAGLLPYNSTGMSFANATIYNGDDLKGGNLTGIYNSIYDNKIDLYNPDYVNYITTGLNAWLTYWKRIGPNEYDTSTVNQIQVMYKYGDPEWAGDVLQPYRQVGPFSFASSYASQVSSYVATGNWIVTVKDILAPLFGAWTSLTTTQPDLSIYESNEVYSQNETLYQQWSGWSDQTDGNKPLDTLTDKYETSTRVDTVVSNWADGAGTTDGCAYGSCWTVEKQYKTQSAWTAYNVDRSTRTSWSAYYVDLSTRTSWTAYNVDVAERTSWTAYNIDRATRTSWTAYNIGRATRVESTAYYVELSSRTAWTEYNIDKSTRTSWTAYNIDRSTRVESTAYYVQLASRTSWTAYDVDLSTRTSWTAYNVDRSTRTATTLYNVDRSTRTLDTYYDVTYNTRSATTMYYLYYATRSASTVYDVSRRTRTATTLMNVYYQARTWGAFSAYSSTSAYESETRKVQTRVVYQYRRYLVSCSDYLRLNFTSYYSTTVGTDASCKAFNSGKPYVRSSTAEYSAFTTATSLSGYTQYTSRLEYSYSDIGAYGGGVDYADSTSLPANLSESHGGYTTVTRSYYNAGSYVSYGAWTGYSAYSTGSASCFANTTTAEYSCPSRIVYGAWSAYDYTGTDVTSLPAGSDTTAYSIGYGSYVNYGAWSSASAYGTHLSSYPADTTTTMYNVWEYQEYSAYSATTTNWATAQATCPADTTLVNYTCNSYISYGAWSAVTTNWATAQTTCPADTTTVDYTCNNYTAYSAYDGPNVYASGALSCPADTALNDYTCNGYTSYSAYGSTVEYDTQATSCPADTSLNNYTCSPFSVYTAWTAVTTNWALAQTTCPADTTTVDYTCNNYTAYSAWTAVTVDALINHTVCPADTALIDYTCNSHTAYSAYGIKTEFDNQSTTCPADTSLNDYTCSPFLAYTAWTAETPNWATAQTTCPVDTTTADYTCNNYTAYSAWTAVTTNWALAQTTCPADTTTVDYTCNNFTAYSDYSDPVHVGSGMLSCPADTTTEDYFCNNFTAYSAYSYAGVWDSQSLTCPADTSLNDYTCNNFTAYSAWTAKTINWATAQTTCPADTATVDYTCNNYQVYGGWTPWVSGAYVDSSLCGSDTVVCQYRTTINTSVSGYKTSTLQNSVWDLSSKWADYAGVYISRGTRTLYKWRTVTQQYSAPYEMISSSQSVSGPYVVINSIQQFVTQYTTYIKAGTPTSGTLGITGKIYASTINGFKAYVSDSVEGYWSAYYSSGSQGAGVDPLIWDLNKSDYFSKGLESSTDYIEATIFGTYVWIRDHWRATDAQAVVPTDSVDDSDVDQITYTVSPEVIDYCQADIADGKWLNPAVASQCCSIIGSDGTQMFASSCSTVDIKDVSLADIEYLRAIYKEIFKDPSGNGSILACSLTTNASINNFVARMNSEITTPSSRGTKQIAQMILDSYATNKLNNMPTFCGDVKDILNLTSK